MRKTLGVYDDAQAAGFEHRIVETDRIGIVDDISETRAARGTNRESDRLGDPIR